MPAAVAVRTPAGIDERRTAGRLHADAVPSITGVRLSPCGGQSFLVNISPTGVLVRCATRLLPGTPVVVIFDGTFLPASIAGRVARCLVADICGPSGLSYHIGIAFNKEIFLEEPPTAIHRPAATSQKAAASQGLVNRW